LEVVPLVLLTLEGYSFMKLQKVETSDGSGFRHKWTIRYLMAVGFWNFLGAGVFGFLINLPIVSYFEIGTYLTPNHGHASMFGVFGMLSLSLGVFILREVCSDQNWQKVEKFIRVAFWGMNIGLMMMLVLSLLPSGFMQIKDAVQNGYWHARSMEFVNSHPMKLIGWFRMPGDLVFIFFGALPFLIASVKVLFRKDK
ncbi:MAG: cbb3-type cytochrome c oxidase subunit I, partial [Bacteroidales bacterium]